MHLRVREVYPPAVLTPAENPDRRALYRTTRLVNGNTYACNVTRIPTKAASAMLWKNTKRRISPSCPYHSVAVLATTMLCASTILPITPPALLAALIRTGESPICCAEIFWRLPNSTLDAVSDPVSATPSQPSNVPKKG